MDDHHLAKWQSAFNLSPADRKNWQTFSKASASRRLTVACSMMMRFWSLFTISAAWKKSLISKAVTTSFLISCDIAIKQFSSVPVNTCEFWIRCSCQEQMDNILDDQKFSMQRNHSDTISYQDQTVWKIEDGLRMGWMLPIALRISSLPNLPFIASRGS